MTLGRAVGRLVRQVERGSRAAVGAGQPAARQLDEGPRSAYELVTRRALDDLVRDFDRLEGKVNGLIFGVVLTFGLEVWKSFR